jgi:hypothetical protein
MADKKTEENKKKMVFMGNDATGKPLYITKEEFDKLFGLLKKDYEENKDISITKKYKK